MKSFLYQDLPGEIERLNEGADAWPKFWRPTSHTQGYLYTLLICCGIKSTDNTTKKESYNDVR